MLLNYVTIYGVSQLREYKHLKTKKGRDESGLFIIEGEKFVQEIPAGWRVVQYVAAERYAKAHDLSQYERRTRCTVVRDSIFDSLADTVSPQGILAVCEQRKYTLSEFVGGDSISPRTDCKFVQRGDIESPPTKSQFLLLGENLNDPGNIGALIRTAAAAGADGMILTAGSGDIYNPKVLRAAAGAVLRLPIVTDAGLADTIARLKEKNIPTYAAHPRGSVTPYELDLRANFCLLVGNESHGISDTAAGLADTLVSLPMVNNTESLNASVAGSILMYEAVRQRMKTNW